MSTARSDSPRLTFLGTGTSGGIPLIACDCAVCTSDDPRDRRTRTGACVRWIDRTTPGVPPEGIERVVLIDCTPDLHIQARREGLWRCDAILFTHNHVDHIFGLDEVRRFNAVMQAPIDIYAERPVMDALRRVYKHIFEQHANVNDSFVATLIPNEISVPDDGEGTPIDLWGVRFTPVRLLHGRLPIVGWRIEGQSGHAVERSSGRADASAAGTGIRHSATSPLGQSTASPCTPLAYCTDVSSVPPRSWSALAGLKTLVLDALRHRHHPTHLTLDQAVNIAERIAAERTYFVHMAHELGHAETEAGLPEHIRLAYDGLTIGPPAPVGSAWRPTPKLKPPTGRFEEG